MFYEYLLNFHLLSYTVHTYLYKNAEELKTIELIVKKEEFASI